MLSAVFSHFVFRDPPRISATILTATSPFPWASADKLPGFASITLFVIRFESEPAKTFQPLSRVSDHSVSFRNVTHGT